MQHTALMVFFKLILFIVICKKFLVHVFFTACLSVCLLSAKLKSLSAEPWQTKCHPYLGIIAHITPSKVNQSITPKTINPQTLKKPPVLLPFTHLLTGFIGES